MNWTKGFSAKYIITRVDPKTWGDIGEVEVTGGTITRDASTDLLESASLDVTEAFEEEWVRVYLIASQEGQEAVRVPLFTGIASTPERNILGRHEANTLDCYSVLKVADDILLPLGYYVPAGVQGGPIIKRLLSDLPCTVTVFDSSPYLISNIVVGVSDSKLKLARQIADAMDWIIRTDGNGNVYVEPKSIRVVATFSSQDADVIEPSVNDNYDKFSIPNVVRVTMNGSTATVRDDDEKSVYSTAQRGREVWKAESVSALSDSESLGAYALRRLKELQAPARTVSYTRRFNPDVVPGSLVSIAYPTQDIEGVFRVQSQDITLGFGASTSEEVVYEH